VGTAIREGGFPEWISGTDFLQHISSRRLHNTCRLQLAGTRKKRELDEPTIRSLVALLSQLAASLQPDPICERITGILITAVSPYGQRTALLSRLQPTTRDTLLQLLQTCLTLMTTIRQTPPPIILRRSGFAIVGEY
jgi:hypothetical protein